MIKCLKCNIPFNTLEELANHIVQGFQTHTANPVGSVTWATDYLARKKVKIPNKVKIPRERICTLCHRPIGKQDQAHCNC